LRALDIIEWADFRLMIAGVFRFMSTCKLAVAIVASVLTGTAFVNRAAGAEPMGEPQLERPTLRTLGVYWIVRGDKDRRASVSLEYRKEGAQAWQAGAPLFRVERGAHIMGRYGSRLQIPGEAWLFAGSALLLEPATKYELRVTLVDDKTRGARPADSDAVSRVLRAQTRSEPRIGAGMRRLHVVPGSGGGQGSKADPLRGLAAAHSVAAPGDVFLIHAGLYPGPWVVHRGGTPEKPIVWSAAGDGPVVIDGRLALAERPTHAIEASGVHDVWFEGLTIQNAHHGLTFHDAARIVIRRCHVLQVDYGLNATRNSQGTAQDHLVVDNLIEGPSTWPRTKGIEDARGIQITGEGHVVAYNRVRGFADAIDTVRSPRCSAIDVHNNDLSELTDDGIEMDYSERNTRCFFNRLTNVFQGISMQPVHGGPIYVFRNVMNNVAAEPFKLHNSPSGCMIFHNTSVKHGLPGFLWTSDRVRNCWSRNNLFVGSLAEYAYDSTAPMVECDFDYDGFAGGPFRSFLRWNRMRYATLAEVRKKAPVEKHAVLIDAASVFASGARPPDDVARMQPLSTDLRLAARSQAIDAGELLPGFNDGFQGRAPDLGAFELGDPLPQYGPRPLNGSSVAPKIE
jgi:hypothetical protein